MTLHGLRTPSNRLIYQATISSLSVAWSGNLCLLGMRLMFPEL